MVKKAIKKDKKVAIILLTCNQKKLLEETIESISKKTSYKNYKIFLVDNGSIDRHDLMVKKQFPQVNIIRNNRNLGYSKGNNVGIRHALKHYDPEYYILLNDDIEITDTKWIDKLVNVAEKDDKIGLVGSQIVYPNGKLQDVGGYLKKWELTKISEFEKDAILDVDHFAAVCMLVKKDLIKNIGILDEAFTPFLLEDSDYCLRAKKAGYSVKVATNTKMIHKKSQSIDSLKNKRSLLIRFKNDILFSRKHLKGKNKLFRIFIYLPLVAILKKKQDTDKLKLKNFRLRKDFLVNLYYLALAFRPKSYEKLMQNVK